MTKDFLLKTDAAKALYHTYAESLPIIDYHCHLNPQEIYEDRQFENITQVWLGADHYKWRLLRSAGVDEKYITGDASDRDKFQKWAETIGLAIGNPLYHWSHLELRNYFDYQGILNGDTAEEVWNLCNKKLAEPSMSARNLIRNSNVKALCTTDDPADTLEWHKKLADDGFEVGVYPSYRPDRAVNVEKPDYLEYLALLEKAADMKIDSFETLVAALVKRLDYFVELGCRVSDHGLDAIPFIECCDKCAEKVFQKRVRGEELSAEDILKFKTRLLINLGRAYHARGLVMQLHFGVIRNNSQRVFKAVGADAGVDSIGDNASIKNMADFLNALDITSELPKTIIYSLNPNDNTAIETVMGCFQTGEAVSKIQHGSAWWFNDQKQGMIDQMTSLANEGFLAGFVGMLTDSRSLLSYARHEYFRRILCNLVGTWVDDGEFPEDEKALKAIIEGICVKNAERYFNL